eukprot:TRINITY_DN33125_c0_g1_i1.p1 TRINITY_DN33125_c0_g1~~TRINITY_DN33125_c0_g1_i1.p1  ORF type:complete len:529 (+),score=107.79 TRINITY_DN33125_c0_g1_i1:46-1632(+)
MAKLGRGSRAHLAIAVCIGIHAWLWTEAIKTASSAFLSSQRQPSTQGQASRTRHQRSLLPRWERDEGKLGGSYTRFLLESKGTESVEPSRLTREEGSLLAEPSFRMLAAGCLALLASKLLIDHLDADAGNAQALCATLGAFLFGRASVKLQSRQTAKQERTSDWLGTLTTQTHGAAALYALTAAGVMDALPPPEAEAMEISELAEHVGLKATGELQRLLLLLSSLGIVECQRCSVLPRFRHTKQSQQLCQGGNARTFAMVHLSPAQVRPWWRIREALSNNQQEATDPFRLEHGGLGPFEFYRDPANAEAARHYNELMRELSTDELLGSEGRSSAELVAALPLWEEIASEPSPLVVDVGGGSGHLLASVLKRHPTWNGVIFDQPHVVTPECLDQALKGELSSRARAIGGDFFANDSSIPGHADVYMLKWVLHDWSDVRCHAILSSIRTAVNATKEAASSCSRKARLLIIEVLRLEPDSADIDMWVIYGGKERTVKEYKDLLQDAGFSTTRVTQLPENSGLVAIEAEMMY